MYRIRTSPNRAGGQVLLHLGDYPVALFAVVFAVSAFLIWLTGTRLAYYGDELAERLNLTREFVGLIFLAVVTELPEIVTTVTAGQVGNPGLVLGNLFGGITLNTAILAVTDIFAVRYALTSWPRKTTHALIAVMLIVLLSILLAVTFVGDVALVLNVGLAAILLACAYPLVISLLRSYDEMESWTPVDIPGEAERQHDHHKQGNGFGAIPTSMLILRSVAFSLVILVAGIALAVSADMIAQKTALGSSFVGVTFLAAATSLPELSTTLAAARIGAYTMAMTNIFGSNLIMIALILPADMAYREGPILAHVDPDAQFSLATGILVTAIYVAGLLIRRTPPLFGAGLDSWLVLIVYVAGLVALYHF